MASDWTAEKTEKSEGQDGKIYVHVTYSSASLKSSFEDGPYSTFKTGGGWPDALINSKLDELNGANIGEVRIGPPAAKPITVVVEKTPDQLKQEAFVVAVRSELQKQKVDAILAKLSPELTKLYDESYASLIVGLF